MDLNDPSWTRGRNSSEIGIVKVSRRCAPIVPVKDIEEICTKSEKQSLSDRCSFRKREILTVLAAPSHASEPSRCIAKGIRCRRYEGRAVEVDIRRRIKGTATHRCSNGYLGNDVWT